MVKHMASKVFQIGFNKCGTRTIHRFLRMNGMRCIHWDDGELARTMFRNLANGDRLLQGYDEDFDVFTDMEWVTRNCILEGFKLYPYLARDYPDARFILNTREREDWVKSRSKHGGGSYMGKWKRESELDADALADMWRADWDRHHTRVTEFFAGKPKQFAQFHIAKDSAQVLADLLSDQPIDISLYGHVGKTKAKRDDVDDDDVVETGTEQPAVAEEFGAREI